MPSYLTNLFRLGLVWFSRESLRDPMDYQVVEAQPDALEAMHSVKFARVARRIQRTVTQIQRTVTGIARTDGSTDLSDGSTGQE